MTTNSFEGQVRERTGGYFAGCPAYPEGFCPDATPVAEYSPEIGVITDSSLFGNILTSEKTEKKEFDCCPVPIGVMTSESKCC